MPARAPFKGGQKYIEPQVCLFFKSWNLIQIHREGRAPRIKTISSLSAHLKTLDVVLETLPGAALVKGSDGESQRGTAQAE